MKIEVRGSIRSVKAFWEFALLGRFMTKGSGLAVVAMPLECDELAGA